MIHAGEDPKFIARRIIISASEDIGNADPNAINIAVSAFNAVNAIGMPEGRIVLSQAAIYMATAPKSNRAYLAIDEALSDIRTKEVGEVPTHLKDGHYPGAKNLGNGIGYKNPHNFSGKIEQDYLPAEFKDKKYYKPTENGYEMEIKKRMEANSRN